MKLKREHIIVGIVLVLVGVAINHSIGGVCITREVSPARCERYAEVESPSLIPIETTNPEFIVRQSVCKSGRWIEEVLDECDEFCSFGKCLPDIGGIYTECASNYSLIEQTIIQGNRNAELRLCKENEVCSGGQCKKVGVTCGDGFCIGTEDNINCFKDCGGLTNWEKFYKEISSDPELDKYIECVGDFNCGTEEITELSDGIIIRYDVKTPREYIDAVVDYVNSFDYELGGGYSQCGESATDILEHTAQGYGINCVDYTVLTIALLREKKIPAIQELGCVSRSGWRCQQLDFLPDIKSKLDRLGHISLESDPFGEQPAGHSWVKVLSPDVGWILVDPTIGQSIGKNCVGYYPTDTSFSDAKCYVSGYDVLVNCRG